MNGYMPQSEAIVSLFALLLAVVLGLGFVITRVPHVGASRAAVWGLVIFSVSGVERLTASEPAGVRMLVLIAVLLWAMKAVVAVEEHTAGRPRLTLGRWCLFVAGWPGMRPSTFASIPSAARRGWQELMLRGLMNLTAGAFLIAFAWYSVRGLLEPEDSPLTLFGATALLLPGISLVMHFGVFNLLAGGWRRIGGDCHALFRAPLKSTSLGEFWGRRWNLAFSEMTTLAVFRPLRGLIGVRLATMAAFLFSGLLHELAISVPVKAGYGLPLLYFALHAAAMLGETLLQSRGTAIDKNPTIGRLWTISWILLPLPILFHRPFLQGCVWPLIGLNVE